MTTESKDAHQASTDAAHREACEYWGYLIKDDKCGTATFDRLLKGIAEVISQQFEPSESADLTPAQLAAFYRAVGGNYDVLFVETPPSSISFIYKSLGAFHSLQPAPDDDGYAAPSIPALKHKGFVTWQTIQLLLGPEEHVPFLQKAVELFDVKDPETGNLFPKVLPKDCFPDRPDDAMEAWYEGVAERLRKDAEEDALEKDRSTRVHVEVDEPGPRNSSDMSGDDERHGAATYFADPLYRKARSRPQFMRHFSKQPTYVEDRGRMAVNRVRHMLNPFGRRRSPAGHRTSDHDYSDDPDKTPIATTAPAHVGVHRHEYPVPPPQAHAAAYPSHKRPHPPRRGSSLSTTDSDSDSDGPSSRHRTPVLRTRRSHDPPTSPREYFPQYYEERRYSQEPPPDRRKEDVGPPPPLYVPTKGPIFATQVAQAQLQAHNYYDRRPGMPDRASYRPVPANVRFSATPVSPPSSDPPYVRDWDRERDRDRDRDRHSYELPSSNSSRHRERDRRRSEEHPQARDRDRDPRDRSDSARTRSHDRVKEDWSDRDVSRDRDRGRDRDRRERDARGDRVRYVPGVAPVEGGVGGRRYPVAEPWR